jgi:FAD/FMN-containing dehydrogenase
VTVAGGRAGSVGVGGFLTGGGNSFHSASHGFGCDQVRNYEVVLADGSVVSANEQENRDLWQALKGGSGNLGLVTRFDVNAIEFEDPANPLMYGGLVGFDIAQTDSIIDAFVDFTNNVPNDVHSSSIMGWGYNPANGGFSIRVVLDNVVNEVNPAAFDVYLKIDGQTSNTLRSATINNITTELIRDYRT